MKKLKNTAGLLLALVLLFCLSSCKNTIDKLEIFGYRFVMTEINDDRVDSEVPEADSNYYDYDTYHMISGGAFLYDFVFSEDGESVTNKIILGEDEGDIRERSGTFQLHKDSVTMVFPDETITLFYDKGCKKLYGNVLLPKINNFEFADEETVKVNAVFSAVSKQGE